MPVTSVIASDEVDKKSEPGFTLSFLARQPLLRSILALCLFEAAFYVAYRYAMAFSHTTPSPFWFPDSILLCALLLVRPRWWWLVLLAPLPIRLFVAVPADAPPWFLWAMFAIDSGKALFTATALKHFIRNPMRFETVRDFGVYCLFAVLLAPALSAFAGAAARLSLGQEDYWSGWEQWLLGDALANLIITPAMFYWIVGSSENAPGGLRTRWLEGALLTFGLILTSYIAFQSEGGGTAFAESRFYAPVPFLFWAAIRFGVRGASAAVLLLACFAVGAALQGVGLFSGLSPSEKGAALQHFLLLRAAPLYLAAVLIEQKQGVERSLRESERRFRSMADSAPVLIWMAGTDRVREFFNRGWLEFTGHTLEQECRNGWEQGVHPEDLPHCLAARDSSLQTRVPYEAEYRLRRHDGDYRWILDKGVPRYAPNGAFLGYIGTALDITDRKRGEEATRNLAHATRLAVVGELTAMIAHEVNQPLCAILSNAEAAETLLTLKEPPLPEVGRILAEICKEDLRASEVIRRIRGLVRNRDIQLQPLDLNETASGVLELVASDAKRRRVQLRSELATGLPLVSADRTYIEQVLLNLIVNAMDAMQNTPEAARELTVQTRRNGDDTVEVGVSDRGGGIPPDQMSRIFESFFTTKPDGMGLGLSMARSIIEAHRGRIWAETSLGSGATIRFTVRTAEARDR
jgi:two-component system, LuxR family, sensor kinase FixL